MQYVYVYTFMGFGCKMQHCPRHNLHRFFPRLSIFLSFPPIFLLTKQAKLPIKHVFHYTTELVFFSYKCLRKFIKIQISRAHITHIFNIFYWPYIRINIYHTHTFCAHGFLDIWMRMRVSIRLTVQIIVDRLTA